MEKTLHTSAVRTVVSILFYFLFVNQSFASLSGTYTIDASAAASSTNYKTFASAVSDMVSGTRADGGTANGSGVSGAVVFNVANGTYSERVVVSGAVSGMSATNNVTFQGANGDSSTVTLDYASNGTLTGTVDLNATGYFNFRKMTILRSGTASTYGMAIYVRGGCSNLTFSHCRITGPTTTSNTTNLAVIYSSTDNDNFITFRNNLISNGAYGFYWNGTTSGTYEQGTIIDSNTITGMYYYGIYIQYQSFELINKNLIQNFGVSNAGYGIYDYYSRYGSKINGNTILGPNGLTMGIYSYYNNQPAGGTGTNSSVTNNMVSIGGTALTYGIYQYYNYLPPTKVAFNSILITNTNTSSAGFRYYDPYTPGDSIYNNSSYNSGGGYAVQVDATSVIAYMDYNNWAVTGTNLGLWNGSNTTSIATWRTASGKDANSQSGNPGYTSSSDLHSSYGGSGGTYLFAKGFNASNPVNIDIDGNYRATAPCIGADEFYSPALDAGITNLSPSVPFNSGSQNIVATIFNYSSTTLTSLNINWIFNGVGQGLYNWTGSLGAGGSANITLGSKTFNKGSSYTFSAHTYSPNGGTDVNAANDSIKKTVCPGLAGGVYTINPSGSGSTNFTTFTAAVNAMSCGGITGAITFKVSDGTYNEQVSIPSIFGTSNTKRITFISNSNDSTKVTLTYGSSVSTANYTLSLNAASFVTFKKMTLKATGSTYGDVIDLRNAPTNDSINSCRILGVSTASNSTNFSNIYLSSTTPSNLVIYNNVFTDGAYGIYLATGNSGTHPEATSVLNNQFTNQYAYGCYMQYSDGVYFNYNTITSTTTLATWYGLYVYWSTSSSRGDRIIGNRIYGNMTGYGMYFYYLGVNSSNATNINNNMVQMGNVGSGNLTYGMYFASSNYQCFVYQNTATVYGTNTGNYACSVNGFVSSASVLKNNIWANLGNGTSTYGGAFYTTAIGSTYSMDYNNYYVLPGGILGNNAGSNSTTLTSWKASVSANDANSESTNPSFTSSSDLHIANLCLRGVSGLGITTDFDNATRNSPPNMGADEASGGYTNDFGVSAIFAPSTPFAAGTQNVVITVRNFGTNSITSGNITYSVNGTTIATQTLGSTLTSCGTTNITFSGANAYTFNFGTSYTLKAWTSSPNGTTDNNKPNDTLVSSLCAGLAGGTYTINPAGSGSSNYTSFANAIAAMGCGGITGPVVFKVADGTYNTQINLTSILGTSASNRVTFISNSNDSTKVTLTNASSISTANYTLSLNGVSYVSFKKMTIQATGTTYGVALDLRGTPVRDSIIGCRLLGISTTSNTTNLAVVYLNGSVPQYFTLYNNVIQDGAYGCYWYTGNSGAHTEFTSILNNRFTNQYSYGMYSQYTDGLYFSNNTVTSNSTLSNFYGAYLYWSTVSSRANQIMGNKISGNMTGYGLYLQYMPVNGSGTTVANNAIQMGTSSSSSLSYAMYATNSYAANYYHNTLVVYGTNTNNAAMYQTSFNGASVFKNNIYANLGNGSTTYGFANYTAGTSNITMDYNDFYVFAGGTVVSNSGTNYTLVTGTGSWNAASGMDANSKNSNPGFVGLPSNISINDPCLRGVTGLGISTDILNVSRSSPPSLGAYEVSSSVNNDLGVLALTSPTSPVANGSQNIVVTVKNYGLNSVTSGTVYYSVNGGTAVSMALPATIASCATATVTFTGSNQYNFTGGGTYSIKSWTSLPNGTTDGKTINDTNTTSLCGAMSGTYTINPAGSGSTNFTSFSAALAQLNCGGISGAVTFNVSNGTYNEQLNVTAITGASSTNTVTFQSASGDSSAVVVAYPTSASAGNNWVLFLNGCQWVRFNKMTFQRSGATNTYATVIQFDAASAGLPACNNWIKHCQILAPSTTSTSTNQSGIYSSGTLAKDTGNIFRNNLIQNNAYGIYINGLNSTPYSGGNTVDSNNITGFYYNGIQCLYQDRIRLAGNTVQNNIYYANYGIYAQNCNGASILSNIIQNIGTGNNYGPYSGIYVSTCNPSANGTNRLTIARNKISLVGVYGSSTYGALHITSCTGISGIQNIVANNMVAVGGTIGWVCHGIWDVSNSYTNYLFNSVWNTSTVSTSAGIYFNSSNSTNTFRNNAIENTGGGYAIYVNGTSSFAAYNATVSLNSMGFNDYYVSGTNFGYWGGTNYAPSTISGGSWATATGSRDNNCLSANPNFLSGSNLTSSNLSLAAGTPVSVTTDYFETTRSATVPSIGATEFPTNNYDASISNINNFSYCSGSTSISATITNWGISTLTSATINWNVNGSAQTSSTWTGSLAYGNSATFTVGSYSFTSGSYTVDVTSSLPNGQTDQVSSNNQFSKVLQQGLNGIYTINPSGSGSSNFTNFTNAISALNTRGLCGPTVFNVSAGTYNSSITLTAISGSSSINTLKFIGTNDSSQVVLSSTNSYTVLMNGANYISFRKMTIQNTAGNVFQFTNGASNDSISSCQLLGANNSSTSTNYALVYYPTPSSSANNCNNNSFYRTYLNYGSFGVYLYAYSNGAGNAAIGTSIKSCTLKDQYYMGVYTVYHEGLTIQGNTITTALGYTNYYGLYFNTYTNNYQIKVLQNKISGCAGGYGIYIINGGGAAAYPFQIWNNFIQGGTGANTFYGFQSFTSNYVQMYYNSFNVTTSNGYAFYSTGNNSNDIRNNIFAASGNGTNSGYACYVSNASTVGTLNYNAYYLGSGGTALFSLGGTPYTTISAWRTSTGLDANSLVTNPFFTSSTNLHASSGYLKAGISIGGVTTDIDGDTRASLPDIGADEFPPPAVDATISAINSGIQVCAGSQTVYATLKNLGTNTLTSDTIKWTVNSVAQTNYTWTGSLATGASVNVPIGTVSFVSNTSYAITVTSTYANTLTVDGFPSNDAFSGTYQTGLTGTYTINPSGSGSTNYTNFTNAVAALTNYGVCGPVLFNVSNGSYNEQISLSPIGGTSTTNTVTFQSLSGDSSLVSITSNSSSSSANNYTVILNGASYVTFSKITIARTSTNTYGRVVELRSGANSNRFLNCRIMGVKSTTTSLEQSLVISTTDNDTGNWFKNNLMRNGSFGFYWYGTSNVNLERGTIIQGNILDSSYYMGISAYYHDGLQILNNDIKNLGYTGGFGLYLYYCQYANRVIKNKIYLPNSGYGMYISYCNSIVSNPSIICNNMVAVGGTSLSYGIYNSYCNAHNYYFNNIGVTNTLSTSRGMYLYGYSATYFNHNLINNNIVNTGGGYAMEVPSGGGTGINISNYNNLYSTGATLGVWNGSSATNLAGWKTTSGKDANSVSLNPTYTSASNLHVSNTGINGKGISISGIVDDIDGQSRGGTPDIGADEFFPYALDAGVVAITPSIPFAAGVQSVVATLQNFGSTTLTSATISWSVNGAVQTSVNWTGSLGTGVSTGVSLGTYTFGLGTSYSVIAKSNNPNGGTDADATNDSFIMNGCPALSGTYSLGGASSDFSNFLDAVNTMICGGVVGPVVFNIKTGIYNEQITLPNIAGASAVNSITFKSSLNNASKVTLAYNGTVTNPYTVKLNGADYVKFKYLTLTAQNATYSNVIQVANGSDNDSILNCVLNGYNSTSTGTAQAIVYSSSSFDQNLVLMNDSFKYGSFGVYVIGLNQGGFTISNSVFTNNYYMGIYLNTLSRPTVQSNNIMCNSAYTNMYGIYLYTNTNGLDVSKNKITGGQGGYGIYEYNSTASATYPALISNNFIQLGTGSNTAYGIYSEYCNYRRILNNSVNITSGIAGGYAGYFNYTSASYNNNEVKNNIFANNGNGTSAGFAMAMYSPTLGYVASDYNQLYSKGTYLTYILINTSSQLNLAAWKSASSLDANSITTAPLFTSNSDLHVSSFCNKGIAQALVTTDIDGNVRSTPPDMGADEVTSGNSNDAGISAILNPTYPMSAGAQNIVVKLKNFGSNTLTSATVSYKVNGGSAVSISWTGSLGACDTTTIIFSGANQYTFSLGTAYTIKAYTSNPNGATDPVKTNDTTTFVGCASLNGVYTINPSGSGTSNFTSFTAAVSALNCSGITGPVTFKIFDGTYNSQVNLTNIVGASAANRVTFISNSKDSTKVTLTYASTVSTANYTLSLNGVNYVTFKQITIQATGSTYGNVVDVRNGSSYDSIKGCRIFGYSISSASSNYSNIYLNSSTPVSFVIYNNVIKDGAYGMYWYTANSNTHTEGTSVLNNQFTNQYAYGCYMQYSDGIYFNTNTITSTTNYASFYGLYIYWSTSLTRGVRVIGNRIYGNMSGYGMYLYYLGVNSSNASNINNNMVQMGSTSSGNVTTGIYFANANYQCFVYHNTAVVYGTNTGNYGCSVNGFVSTSSVIKNNIWANLGNGTTTYGAAYYTANIGSTYTMDYNNYYVLNGNIANNAGTNATTLASWKTSVSPNDVNAESTNPGFTSSSNLHISNLCLRGVSGLGITTDFDGDIRNSSPSMGADEATGGSSNDAGVSAVVTPVAPVAAGTTNVVVTVKNFGNNTLTSATVSYAVKTNSGAYSTPFTQSLSTSLAPCGTTSVTYNATSGAGSSDQRFTFSAGNTYTIKSWTSGPNGSTDPNVSNDTTFVTFCTGLSGTYTINPSGSGSTNFTTFTAAVNALTCGGVLGNVVFNVSSGTYTEQLNFTSIQGASASKTIVFKAATGVASNVTLRYTGTSTNNYTVRLAGSPFVVFRQMTISALSSSYGTVFQFAGTTDDSIKNCVINGINSASTSTNLAIFYSNSSKDERMVISGNTINYGAFGIYMYCNSGYATGNVIFQNTFSNPYYMAISLNQQDGIKIDSNIISMTGGYTSSYGIYLINGQNKTRITKNKITGQAGGYGIYFSSVYGNNSTNKINVTNNFISIGSGSNTAYPFYQGYTNYCNVYHNSFNVTSADVNSYAYYQFSGSTGNSFLDTRNNIFANNGGGRAIYFYNSANGTCNNNQIYTTGSIFGANSGSTFNDLSAWKTTGNDASSVGTKPLFTSSTDLHITGGCTPAGALVGVSTDIDNDTRSGTSPIIGADEFVKTNYDMGAVVFVAPTSPAATGTPYNVVVKLVNYGGLTVTQLNVSYKLNNLTPVKRKLTGLSLLSCDTLTVTFNSTSGPGSTDQRVTFGTGFNSMKIYSDTINATNIDAYHSNDTVINTFCSPHSGNYTINPSAAVSSTNFQTFTAAMAAMQNCGIAGAVNFKVSNGTYNEKVEIIPTTGMSSTNTITFESLSGDSTKVILTQASSASSTNNYTLDLNGGDYYTFKKITIQRTGVATYGRVVEVKNGSNNNHFMNCRIIGVKTTAAGPEQALIYSAGDIDSGMWIRNCVLKNGSIGINLSGVSSFVTEKGTFIENNLMDSSVYASIYILYQDAPRLIGNKISQAAYSGIALSYGVRMEYCGSALRVLKNRIYNGTNSGFNRGLYMINCTSSGSSPGLVANNFITTTGGTTYSTAVALLGTVYQNFYHNCILNISSNSAGSGLIVLSGLSGGNNEIYNNSIVNKGAGMAVEVENGATSFISAMNRNNIFVTGTTVADWNGGTVTSLSAWRTNSGLDAASISVDPQYTSNSDLHINTCALKNRAVYFAPASVDMDGNTRDALPDIGAVNISGNPGRWIGAVSTDWFNSSNWCTDTLPTCSNNFSAVVPIVTLTGATTNYPIVAGATGTVKNLTVAVGASLTMNTGGKLDICGNFICAGSFIANAGTFEFSGSGPQDIPGLTYFDLKINGSGLKTLLDDAFIKHNLTTAVGNTNTWANHATFVMDSAATITESATSFVTGLVEVTRPMVLGVSESFGGIGLILKADTTSPGITTVIRRTGDSAIQTGQMVHGGGTYSGIKRHYEINPTVNGNLGLTMTMGYQDAELNSIPETDLAIYRKEDGNTRWDFMGYGSRNSGSNTVTLGGIDSLSVWTIGSEINPLPVELTYFEASLSQDKKSALLNWRTASELNNDHFDIERTIDGVNWIKIGQEQGNGTTANQHDYFYEDNNINTLGVAELWYRLKQVDYNGSFEYSPVRNISLNATSQEIRIKSWYNRSKDQAIVVITSDKEKNGKITISDNVGRILCSKEVKISSGFNETTLPMNTLPAGIYSISVSINGKTETCRISKQ